MSRSALSEQVNRLLPGEKWKRVREAILQSATYSGQRLDTLRRNIDQENRLKDGKLQDGTLDFPDSTTAELDLFVWVINYQIFQPGFTSLPVLAHDPDFPRPDVFTGDGTGTIKYYPGTIDSEGNGQFPDIPEGEVILREVLRNTDGSNDSTPGNGGGNGKYVSLNDTGTQVVKSYLGSEPLAGSLRDSLYPDANGVFRKVRVDYHGVYSTVEGVGATDWSKIVTINVAGGQLRYFVMLEYAGVSPSMEKGMVWIQFETDGSGNLTVNKLKVFGEINPAKLKMVKLDTNTYGVFVHHNEAGAFFKFRPQFSFGGSTVYTYHHQAGRNPLPIGTRYDFELHGDLTEIESAILVLESDLTDLEAQVLAVEAEVDDHEDRLTTVESDLTDLEGQVLAVESEVDDHESRITDLETAPKGNLVAGSNVTLDGVLENRLIGAGNVTINATGGGGTGSGGYTDLVGFPVIPFDKNYRYAHEMAEPVEISVNTTLVRAFPNHTILYIKANGVDKPTFKASDNFSILMDDWNNTAGEWNRIRLEWSPQLRPVGQITDTSGATSPGTGSTVITLTFEDNHSSSHVITGTVSLAVDDTDAAFPNRTILYFQADGVNKPMWDDPIECNFDNYINEAGVWNRFFLEWTPENKVTLQISNT